jgi:hypothetical protein
MPDALFSMAAILLSPVAQILRYWMNEQPLLRAAPAQGVGGRLGQ